ncbi:MAG: hypothetical protein Q9208_001203 [Pyrenodesmia sp. 3 TL-2023]
MAPKSLQKDSRIKEAQFLKTVEAGTWQSFLEQDAIATQKSIRAWWYNIYSHSAAARALAKQAKKEIQELFDMLPPIKIDREELHPDTVVIIEAWEALPLEDETEECKKAKHRLLADLVDSDQLKEALSNGLRKYVDLHMVAEARCWLYRGPDGAIQRFTPLKQPWRYKALQWDDNSQSLLSGVPFSTDNDLPNPPVKQTLPCNSEHLRLSLLSFWTLIDVVNSTGPSGLTALHSPVGSDAGLDDNGAFGESISRSATPGPSHQKDALPPSSSAGKWKAVNDPPETEPEPDFEPTWVVDSEPQDVSHRRSSIRYSPATEIPLGWPISSPTTDEANSYLPERARSSAPEPMNEEDAEVEMTDDDALHNHGGYRFPSLEPIVDDVQNDADAEMTTEYEEVSEEGSESSEGIESSDMGVEIYEDDRDNGR